MQGQPHAGIPTQRLPGRAAAKIKNKSSHNSYSNPAWKAHVKESEALALPFPGQLLVSTPATLYKMFLEGMKTLGSHQHKKKKKHSWNQTLSSNITLPFKRNSKNLQMSCRSETSFPFRSRQGVPIGTHTQTKWTDNKSCF